MEKEIIQEIMEKETRVIGNMKEYIKEIGSSKKILCPNCRTEFGTLFGKTIEDILWMLRYFGSNAIKINPKRRN